LLLNLFLFGQLLGDGSRFNAAQFEERNVVVGDGLKGAVELDPVGELELEVHHFGRLIRVLLVVDVLAAHLSLLLLLNLHLDYAFAIGDSSERL
jgi:hypothetical protein